MEDMAFFFFCVNFCRGSGHAVRRWSVDNGCGRTGVTDARRVHGAGVAFKHSRHMGGKPPHVIHPFPVFSFFLVMVIIARYYDKGDCLEDDSCRVSIVLFRLAGVLC